MGDSDHDVCTLISILSGRGPDYPLHWFICPLVVSKKQLYFFSLCTTTHQCILPVDRFRTVSSRCWRRLYTVESCRSTDSTFTVNRSWTIYTPIKFHLSSRIRFQDITLLSKGRSFTHLVMSHVDLIPLLFVSISLSLSLSSLSLSLSI